VLGASECQAQLGGQGRSQAQLGNEKWWIWMKISPSLAIFSTIAGLCFVAMVAVTFVWMYVPTRIVYQESSPVKTERYSIEVREHGHPYFITPKQKQVLDLIRFYTPVIWFSGFGYLFFFFALGGFERLRLLQRRPAAGGGSP
jgi:hypothetical protein